MYNCFCYLTTRQTWTSWVYNYNTNTWLHENWAYLQIRNNHCGVRQRVSKTELDKFNNNSVHKNIHRQKLNKKFTPHKSDPGHLCLQTFVVACRLRAVVGCYPVVGSFPFDILVITQRHAHFNHRHQGYLRSYTMVIDCQVWQLHIRVMNGEGIVMHIYRYLAD